MAIEKPKKSKKTKIKSNSNGDDQDLASLATDVATFASSLGLSAAAPFPAAGFDDSDFRKSGPLKAPKPPQPPNPSNNPISNNKEQIKAKPHPLNQVDVFASQRTNNHSLNPLPLVKASLLSGNWYVDAGELERKVLGDDSGGGVAALGIQELKKIVEAKKELGLRLLEQYTVDYENTRKKSGDMKLLEVTTRSGTSVDKVSAFTCLVEDNPLANMKALDALLSMVTSKVGKRYAFTGFEALKELFILKLLPDRKLKSLFQRPLTTLPETKDGYSLLLFWYWEECLKQRYERYVIALEEALKDMLPNLKNKALKIVFELLKSKSEQERRLLTALVNKLGDPDRKAASGAMFQLSCLLSAHPNMKAVVIDEVDTFIFRPNIGLRAKYQAVNFLSQILLSKKGDGPKVAKRLVDIYFALFKVLISESEDSKTIQKSNNMDNDKKDKGRKGFKVENNKNKSTSESSAEMDSRLLSALLTGINRAFPFVSSDEADSIIEEQTPTLFKLVHSKNFNVGIQALMLLYQISSKNQIASDRFYRALYAKLLTPAAVSSSKPEMFLGLLVKSLKNDLSLKRVSAFAKRLLQVALQRPPQYACGCLFILSEVLKAKPPLWSIVLQNEIADDDVEHFEDIVDDPEDLAILPHDKPAKTSNHSSDDDTNNFQVDEHESDIEGEESSKVMPNFADTSNGNAEDDDSPQGTSLPAGYNPRHREPLHCNADRSCWWELTILAAHVHPSVATMARTLLSGANIVYNGDPLNDLSLTAFIDKFMEKKPKPNRKAEGSWHGGSQIAPARKVDMSNHLIGEEMLQLAEDEVPPEDVVFHRFYMNKATLSKKAKKKKKTSEDEDADDLVVDGSDVSDDEEIDDALGSGHHPIEEFEGDYDYDDLDRIANEDDDDLIRNDSDDDAADTAVVSGKKHGATAMDVDDEDGSDDIWDASGDGGSDDDDIGVGSDDNLPIKVNTQKKQKSNKKSKASPFASLEDYEHLMDDENNKQKAKSRKKRKLSK